MLSGLQLSSRRARTLLPLILTVTAVGFFSLKTLARTPLEDENGASCDFFGEVARVLPSGTAAASIHGAVGDLTGDGRLDFVLVHSGDGGLSVITGDPLDPRAAVELVLIDGKTEYDRKRDKQLF